MRFAALFFSCSLLASLAAEAAADVAPTTLAPQSAPLTQRAPTDPSSPVAAPAAESPPVATTVDELSPPPSPLPSAPNASPPAQPKRERAKAKRLSSIARAAAKAEEPLPESGVTLGMSFPLRMLAGDGGFSITYGFARHYAVRANFASFSEIGPIDFDRESSYDGRSTDLGVGFVWYPRRLWSGPTFEAGAFARKRYVEVQAEDDAKLTDTGLIASRFLVGWSWRSGDAFLAVAAGVALGYERGTATRDEGYDDMPPVEKHLSRVGTATETYFRAGFVFGK